MENIKKYIVQYQAIIGFVLGILATLAAMTPTLVDDGLVESLNNLNNTIVEEVSPTVVIETPVVVEENL